MDFLTHSLVGAGAARLICPRRAWLPQLSLAALLGSLTMDGDSWLALLGPDAYGLYHRVWSHSLIGLGAMTALSVGGGWAGGVIGRWRRFGWFVTTNLPENTLPSRPPWGLFLLVSASAALLHWCFDVITGYGNLYPLWPWNRWEASLHAVFSFDAIIFSLTLGWHLVIRHLDWPRRREWPITAAYAMLLILYVIGHILWGRPTYI